MPSWSGIDISPSHLDGVCPTSSCAENEGNPWFHDPGNREELRLFDKREQEQKMSLEKSEHDSSKLRKPRFGGVEEKPKRMDEIAEWKDINCLVPQQLGGSSTGMYHVTLAIPLSHASLYLQTTMSRHGNRPIHQCYPMKYHLHLFLIRYLPEGLHQTPQVHSHRGVLSLLS
jgi:hypothetical protein